MTQSPTKQTSEIEADAIEAGLLSVQSVSGRTVGIRIVDTDGTYIVHRCYINFVFMIKHILVDRSLMLPLFKIL